MEQIVVLILFVVGSIISSIIQNRKKREEEERQHRDLSLPAPQAPPPLGKKPPFLQWPKNAADWQEELRRLLEPETQPPPIPPRTIPTSIIRERVVDAPVPPKRVNAPAETKVATRIASPKMGITPPQVHPLARWTRHSQAARQAFVASIIFAPPVALNPQAGPPY